MKESTFQYKITAEDYLTHQLFSASQNKTVSRQRTRGLILWTSAFLILSVLFYIQKDIYLAAYFILFGIGFVLIYPMYSRWIYKRYFKRFVYRNFEKSNLENLWLKIGNDITLSNGKEEGIIPISDIEIIFEISTHIFLKLKGGKNIIIPKQKIENKEELLEKISSLSQKYNIQYVKMLDWKWK